MITTDQKILRTVSKETAWEEVKRLNLKEKIQKAMKTAWCPGLGLAAIQIGVPLRYAWYRIPKENHPDQYTELELLNPKIITLERPFVYSGEGCLSIPNYRAKTRRYLSILVESDGCQFAASNLEAVVIQHEIDHMNGILVLDIVLDKYPKLGRNDACGCGSLKKYKKCCLRT